MPANKLSNSPSGGPYRKPRADIYTVLLVLALVALIVGIVMLWLEMDLYQWKFSGGPRASIEFSTPTRAVAMDTHALHVTRSTEVHAWSWHSSNL